MHISTYFLVTDLCSSDVCVSHFFMLRLKTFFLMCFAFKMELIWEELGAKFKDLFEVGRSGVVASVIATGQRLHSHETQVLYPLIAY